MDADNLETNAAPDAVPEAECKEQEAIWDETYPEPTDPDQDGDQPVADEVAELCVSFAEEYLYDMGPCIDLVGAAYAQRGLDEMADFLAALTAALPMLCGRMRLARGLATVVRLYCEEPYIVFRAEMLQIAVRALAERLHATARRIMRELRAIQAELRGRAQRHIPDIPENREEEAPRVWNRTVVTPWYTRYARRLRGGQRLSCDLRWKREARGCLN